MGVQTSYNYGMNKGVPGGLFDIAEYENNTYLAGTGITFGIGVVSNASGVVEKPTSASKAENFSGVTMNGFTTEQDSEGNVAVMSGQSIGVLKHGNIWVVLGKNAVPGRDKAVYLITDGEEAGAFTTDEDTSTKIALQARYLMVKDNGIAPVRFYNQMNTTTAGA